MPPKFATQDRKERYWFTDDGVLLHDVLVTCPCPPGCECGYCEGDGWFIIAQTPVCLEGEPTELWDRTCEMDAAWFLGEDASPEEVWALGVQMAQRLFGSGCGFAL